MKTNGTSTKAIKRNDEKYYNKKPSELAEFDKLDFGGLKN